MTTRFQTLCLLLFIGLTGLTACQQEPDERLDPEPEIPAVSGNLKATINGNSWVAARAAGASRMNGLINISGLSLDGKILTMTLTDSGVHRYILNSTTLNAAAHVDSTMSDRIAFTSNSSDDAALAGGEVTITSINESAKTLTGTFSYRVYRSTDNKSVSITNGSFTDLSYTTSLAPSTGSDTIRLKVDGADFRPDVVFGISSEFIGQLGLSGTTTAGSPSIGLSMPPDIRPGTHDFGDLIIGVYNPGTDGTNARGSNSGKLVILEHNTSSRRIRGTFNFSASNLLDPSKKNEITDGYFSVKYQ
ncbi:MAG: hypothetical protein EOO09_11545 [Chitinophagaceae bacterium]|nr:MAG: hypothetical protein EOO09_11545 [Chitinophagaceae bacterium]